MTAHVIVWCICCVHPGLEGDQIVDGPSKRHVKGGKQVLRKRKNKYCNNRFNFFQSSSLTFVMPKVKRTIGTFKSVQALPKINDNSVTMLYRFFLLVSFSLAHFSFTSNKYDAASILTGLLQSFGKALMASLRYSITRIVTGYTQCPFMYTQCPFIHMHACFGE